MATAQIQGVTTANIAEVEANTKALRVTLRPEDFGSLGIYSLGANSGVMAAGLGSAAPIFSFRWGDATRLALVKRVTFSAASITALTAGVGKFDLFAARSFSVSDSAGTGITPTGNQGKLRTSMGTTLLTDARISSTATLTAGTRTLDANPLGSICAGVLNTAGAAFVTNQALFDVRPGEHPLVLAQNEGLVLQATVPGVGTWSFSVRIEWTEIAAY